MGQDQQPPDPYVQTVIAAWNLAGGLDWNALPTVAAMLDVDDIDLLVRGLVQIRDWHAAAKE
jgi:hypothetical protein